jgi:hypothetical protein
MESRVSRITKQDRLRILELAAGVASEAAKNTNVVWMIEFQELLVEALYRKMTSLLESDLERFGDAESAVGEPATPVRPKAAKTAPRATAAKSKRAPRATKSA